MPTLSDLPSLAQRPTFAPIAHAASVLGTGGGANRHGNTAVTTFTALQAILAATFIALSPLAQAQPVSIEHAYGLSGRIGLGLANVPTYEGSPNRRMVAVPDLTLSYRSRDWGTVEFGQRGLFWSAVESGSFRSRIPILSATLFGLRLIRRVESENLPRPVVELLLNRIALSLS